MKLKDKVVVITGSTRGIGRAIARSCAQQGARVIISSRKESAVKETCKTFQKENFKVSGIKADVAVNEDLIKLFNHSVETWGQIDVWINNAGLSAGMRFFDELSEEEIKEIVNVNITGTMQASRIIIPYFIKQEKGILINMGGMGSKGEKAPHLTAYALTKAAVNSFTKNLAEEYKEYPISIHMIIPGMVETDFYNNIKVSPKLTKDLKNLPYALKAFSTPIEKVGEFCMEVAAQEPGKNTGKTYSLLRGTKLMRGIALMIWYRLSSKMK
ncbi:3-phenylpropionate-dihydrodiol/cinnamic acid-dihydrodiol dehydrogenase [subsurface metagenome]